MGEFHIRVFGWGVFILGSPYGGCWGGGPHLGRSPLGGSHMGGVFILGVPYGGVPMWGLGAGGGALFWWSQMGGVVCGGGPHFWG